MRRLSIYFLLDTFLSMSGKPIEMVENCINGAIKHMKSNAVTLETIVVNIISFGNNKITFLEENKSVAEISFQKFKCSGYSNNNYGLEAVRDDHNYKFIKTTAEKKGDWKPMLFVFSGIAPSTKIDNSLIDFFEKKFSNYFIGYSECFVVQEFEYISKKANCTFIVTSDNEFTKSSYKNYFSNVYSYEDVRLFVQNFNNFFKWG